MTAINPNLLGVTDAELLSAAWDMRRSGKVTHVLMGGLFVELDEAKRLELASLFFEDFITYVRIGKQRRRDREERRSTEFDFMEDDFLL